MPGKMTSNRNILDVWIEVVCAELEELLHIPVTATADVELAPASSAYRSRLLFEGPVHGVMYVTGSAASLVQLAQLVAGESVNPHAAWTEEGLEVWQIWLTAAGPKLASRLRQEFPESAQGTCSVLLGETTAVEGDTLASGPETAASGALTQQWLLRAGDGEIAFSSSVQMEFPGETSAIAATAEEISTTPTAEPVAQEKPDLRKDAAGPSPQAGRSSSEDRPPQDHAHGNARELQVEQQPTARQSADNHPPQSETRLPGAAPKQRLDLLLDIELEATLRFGALELPLREVLELGPGDVLPLDRHVHEPVDLVVGDRIVARGEVVLVGGNFALHVTEVAEPRRRLETIRCLF